MSGLRRMIVFVGLLALFSSAGCQRQGPPTGSNSPAQVKRDSSARLDRPSPGANARGKIESRPLNSPIGGEGPLFQKLPPDQTGVDFVNALKRQNNLPFINNGSGVAVADYDSDGRPDIFLLGLDCPNRLYRQVAPFQFEDVTERAGVACGDVWSRGASFVDLDNDGDLDLYVCNSEAPNQLFINQADGTFIESAKAYGLNHDASSYMAYFADYDRDGDLDMYLITYRALRTYLPDSLVDKIELPGGTTKTIDMLKPATRLGFSAVEGKVVPKDPERTLVLGMEGRSLKYGLAGQRDVLFRNNGDGTFTDVTDQTGVLDYGLGLSATWMDFNHDGWLDLHVGNDLYTRDRLFLNNRNGTFTDALGSTLPQSTWFSMGADFADINNDGLFDFLVADMAGTTHYRAKIGMGDMSKHRWFLMNEWPRQQMYNALFLNTATGHYMQVAHLVGVAASDWTWGVKFGDLDNDGLIDIFVTNGTGRDGANPDLVDLSVQRILQEEGEKAATDFLGNLPPLKQENIAFRNLGDLRFEPVSSAWGLDHRGASFGAAQADFDRDGDLDLVVNNLNEPASIYRNHGTRGHRLVIELQGVASNRLGVGAKLTVNTAQGTQVRQLMLGRGYLSCDQPIVHFGLGENETVDQLTVQWPSGHVQVFENLPADRLYTITEPDTNPPAPVAPTDPPTQFEEVARECGLQFKHREQPFDDYAVQPLIPGKLSQFGPGLAFGDADGDGDDDLFVGGAAGQAGELYVNQGRGTFRRGGHRQPWEDDGRSEDMAPLWFDADGDGDLDLYVASGSVECEPEDPVLRDRLYLNDGAGRFVPAAKDALPDEANSSGVVVAADFDTDGDLDLFVGGRVIPGQYPLPPRSQLLRNDGGTFQDVADQLAPSLKNVGLVTSALWSDVDDDGDPDLLLALEWGPVKYFRNAGGKLVDETSAAGLQSRTGWWNSITGGDIDGDGDIDYVVMNVGLNTKYGEPTAEKPVSLYYGDMDGTGQRRLVEAKTDRQGLVPIRGRSCSSQAMPFIGEKFTSYHDFALAVLPEIYTPQCLTDAYQLSANHFESGILINDGSGRFEWRSLPRLSQVSPGFGVVVTDFDADGNTDVYAVQNLFTRELETGVWRGGLSCLLSGDGKGNLQWVSPAQSGLVVRGDAKGLAVCDLNEDGWPDVVLTQNDDKMMAFRNNGVSGRRPLAIRLKGPAGNPTAAGARVTVIHADGTRQTAELYSGSGYLSQSSPCLFFGTGNAAGPSSIQVRWPDGRQSRHTPDRIGKQQVIEHRSLLGRST